MCILKGFVDHKVNLNVTNNEGATALFFACDNEQVDCLEYLLSQGANLNAVNVKQQTVLHYATENGKTEHIRLLLEHIWKRPKDQAQAFINAKDRKEKTALHYASENSENDTGMIKLLRQFGSNPLILDYRHQSSASLWSSEYRSKDTELEEEKQALIAGDQQIRSRSRTVRCVMEFAPPVCVGVTIIAMFTVSVLTAISLKLPAVGILGVTIVSALATGLAAACLFLFSARYLMRTEQSSADQLTGLEQASGNITWGERDIEEGAESDGDSDDETEYELPSYVASFN